MTDEGNNRSLDGESADQAMFEECPTLEIPEESSPSEDTTPSTDQWLLENEPSVTDEEPTTITMGWAARDDDPDAASREVAPADDTSPELLIWEVDQPDSMRDTIRDARAFERTQIIDMDQVMEASDPDEPVAADEHALSDLAGAVGHELNNPLTTCVGYLRQLSSMIPHDDDQLTLMLDRLGRNLNRIHSIVGELEMLAAESSGQRQRIDLAVVVERVHDQLESFLDAHVELQLRSAYLRADRPRLYQLVYIILAAHMLDSHGDNHCRVRVSPRSVGTCLEVNSPRKPQGSLRLDLLGILRRNTLDGSTPLGLAAGLTREMGGSWYETALEDGYQIRAVLPRRSPGAKSKGPNRRQPGEAPSQDSSKTSFSSHWSNPANRSDTWPRSRR